MIFNRTDKIVRDWQGHTVEFRRGGLAESLRDAELGIALAESGRRLVDCEEDLVSMARALADRIKTIDGESVSLDADADVIPAMSASEIASLWTVMVGGDELGEQEKKV